jgi:WD40 repeat protein
MSDTELTAAGPYKGLAPFGDSELDGLLFFGREREREIVVANLIAARLTVLYGPSGVGKSSLLRAGVARSLRDLPEQPVVVVFSSWTENPAAALAAAVCEEAGVPVAQTLRDAVAAVGDRDVYLMLDQAEEYFLYHGSGERAFEEALALAVTEPLRVNVLLSLREDALAKLDRFKGRIPNLFGNFLRLDRLDRDAGRAAIVRPVDRWNELEGTHVDVEPGLVESVLTGVGAGRIEPGVGGVGAEANGRPAGIEAPYLQLVMQRLWEVERGSGSERLREATLESLGGAARIVAEHLERAVDELEPSEKDIAAELSRFLVTPSGAKIAHTLSDLAGYTGVSERELQPVAKQLTDRRILRTLDTDGGVRYEIFHDVLTGAVLGWRNRYQAERALERERAVARKRHRRLGFVAVAALIAAGAMATLTVWAMTERRYARAKTILVHARELDATALSRRQLDPELSLLLAAQAARIDPTPQAEDVLRDALRTSRLRWIVHTGHAVVSARFDRTGRRFLVASADGKVRLYNGTSRALLRTLDHGAPIRDARFSPNGKLVATAGTDGLARIWTVGGALVRAVRHGAPIEAVSFDPSGSLLATAGGHAAKLWRVRGRGLVAELRTPKPVAAALFSPDGTLVAVIARDRLVRLFRVTKDRKPAHVLDQGTLVTAAAFAPDGRTMVVGGKNRTATLWSLRTWRPEGELTGHVGRIRAVSFSPHGDRVATSSQDGTARVWSVHGGVATADVVQLWGHSNPVVDVGFSPDGQYVVTSSGDDTAQVFSADKGARRSILAGDTDTVSSSVFSPDGRLVLTASDDGTARLWDPGTAVELIPTSARAPAPPDRSAVSRDGMRATVRGNDVVLTGKEGTMLLRGHRDRVLAVAFSPDGTRLVTASRDNEARIWDVATGRSLHRLRAHYGAVVDARFSPDGRWIVTAGPKTAGLWVASTGLLLGLLRGPTSPLTAAAFEPDSTAIVTSDRSGVVRRYVCDVCGSIQHLVALADDRLAATGRRLTSGDRRRYGL